LSRITEPTTGKISINGRVASLLEVGTGFHPELTGRENIFLNGAILGMDRVEIKRKFDEIVAFAEVEKFLDTPVKRYSSGMYVRLAFAVAAHLEPEILIVDEVLAVGDAQFQKKCLGKMEEVSGEGRTILFVSHNMGTINQLCTTAYLLQKGCILKSGNTKEVITEYLNAGVNTRSKIDLPFNKNIDGQYLTIRTVNSSLTQTSEFSCDDAIRLELIYEIRKKTNGLYLAFYIENSEAVKIIFTDSKEARLKIEDLSSGNYKFCIVIPKRILAPDSYYVTIGSANILGQLDLHQKILCFNVCETSESRSKRPSVLSLQPDWQYQSL
jgi:lipopolysaccharide transport system ATP-binding protein